MQTSRSRLSAGYARHAISDKIQDANLGARLVAVGAHLPDDDAHLGMGGLFVDLCEVRDELTRVMQRAVDTGDLQIIRATALEIVALFEVMEAQALAPIPTGGARPFA